jgi:steroid 5-alpha reductase family enzyme
MLDFTAYSLAFMVVALLALGFWIFSLIRDDVSIVDSLWSIMFLVLLAAYLVFTDQVGPRKWLLLALVSVWAVRLSAYISIRNHGKPEDHRYQAIRKNNEPNFGLKSLPGRNYRHTPSNSRIRYANAGSAGHARRVALDHRHVFRGCR